MTRQTNFAVTYKVLFVSLDAYMYYSRNYIVFIKAKTNSTSLFHVHCLANFRYKIQWNDFVDLELARILVKTKIWATLKLGKDYRLSLILLFFSSLLNDKLSMKISFWALLKGIYLVECIFLGSTSLSVLSIIHIVSRSKLGKKVKISNMFTLKKITKKR